MRVNRGKYLSSPDSQASKGLNILDLTETEAATIVNALEEKALGEPDGSDEQLRLDGLALAITRVTGY